MSPAVTSDTRADARRKPHFARVDPTLGAVVHHDREFSVAAEHYRNLAFRLEEEARSHVGLGFVVAVTSAEPATGKTLVSLNLALTLARGSESRVLLIEGDLRRPALDGYLQTFTVADNESKPPLVKSDGIDAGLAQVLEGRLALSEAALQFWGTGLDLLPAGTQGRIDDLLAHERMGELLAHARARYRLVVIDSPPLILADGRSLAARSDGTLLIVRAGRTKRKQVEEALSLLDSGKLLGLVLNATKVQPETPYSHYESERDPLAARVERETTEE